MKIPITRLHRKVMPGFTLAALLVTTSIHAQTQAPAASQASAPADAAPQKLSAEDLNDLLGPIALYPDALVALILPASTVPSDITLAARYLNQNGDNADVSDQPWDPSVRSLAEYPDVLKWMDDNLEWTTSLGEAFVEQPTDVMNAVQTLRLAAKDKGNLKNTPQQTVVVQQQADKQVVEIVPTDPETIYVPVYDPEVVYVQPYQPDYTPLITFGVGLAVGSWLNYDCDWGGNDVYYGPGCGWNNQNRWNYRGDYDRGNNVNVINTNTVNNTNINNNYTNITNNSNVSRWQPSATSKRQFNQRQREGVGNARIARANASAQNVKNPKNAANRMGTARPAQVARPKMPGTIAKNPRTNHPNANKAAANNQNPGKGPNANRGNPGQPNAKKPNQGNHPKAPTAAPNAGEGNGKKPNANKPHPNSGNGNQANGQNNKKPSAAPSGQGGGNNASSKPKNPGGNGQGNNNKPNHPNQNGKKPGAAPQQGQQQNRGNPQQSKPKPQQAQPRPQQQSKPKPQAQQQSKPKPQQAQPRPQQSKPKPQQAQPRPQQQSKPKPQQAQPHPQQQAKPQGKPQGQPQGNGGNGGNNKKKKKDQN